jgi:hypothetical protein
MKDKKKTFSIKREKSHRPPDTARHMPWVLLFFVYFAFISFLNVDVVHAQKTAPEGLTQNTGPEPAVLLTTEEKAWLKAHPAIRFGFMERYEPYI